MRLKHKFYSAIGLANAYLFHKKIPLCLCWLLTNRCNLKCSYCDIWNRKQEEVTTEQAFSIIDDLASLGTQRLNLFGGEPLLRDDIGEIINHCKEKGISVGIGSNGVLVPKKIEEILNADTLHLSFDGPEDVQFIHTGVRNTYSTLIDAIQTAKEHNMPVWTLTVLTKYNVDLVDYILDTAKEYNFISFFHPVINRPLCRDNTSLFPPEAAYKNAIKKLIKAKKNGAPVGNSLGALEYLYNWPRFPKPVSCWAGKLRGIIDTNGDVYRCGTLIGKTKPLNCLEVGFKKAFESIETPVCEGCWDYAHIEFNLLFSFNPTAIINAINLTK